MLSVVTCSNAWELQVVLTQSMMLPKVAGLQALGFEGYTTSWVQKSNSALTSHHSIFTQSLVGRKGSGCIRELILYERELEESNQEDSPCTESS